ncbi:MAG TPA: asparagine synthase (glutamine-hydrolyzing) [Actinomycetota bacterium]|nr:asparagine synthase (glutamine-hydrolyzing) [Actinomycetota bacterium]
MCGIAGFVKRRAQPNLHVLQNMLNSMRHRGSDAFGHSITSTAAIGMARLAIVDLETGDPPFADESGEVSAVLNGEIYNYGELRRDLFAQGHQLRSAGDTETIAHLAEFLSPTQLASALDGMFAIAVWDERTQELTLIRDRLGKKPLYYWSGGSSFVFASEIKGLLIHPEVPRSVRLNELSTYLMLGYVPTPYTFFEGIVSLPPAHLLTFSFHRGIRIARYWEPPRRQTQGPSRSLARQQAASLLTDAVQHRLESDVPVGALLSGGLDSTAVVATMARLLPVPVPTFSVAFGRETGYDESEYSRLVATTFGTDHHELQLQPPTPDLIETLVHHHDQPFGDSSALPTYLLAKFAKEHVTVVLGGDGGDELFAGYDRFIAARLWQGLRSLPFPIRKLLIAGASPLAQSRIGRMQRIGRFAKSAGLEIPRAYAGWLSYASDDWRQALLGSRGDDAMNIFESEWEKTTKDVDVVGRLLELNLRTYLLDDLLPKTDRMSMAHALEVRSPFLDRKLLEWSFQLPSHYLIRRRRGKAILREALAGIVPPEILSRQKRGFGIPLDSWLRNEYRTYLVSTLDSRTSRIGSILDAREVHAVVASHVSGKANMGHLLWALLTLELFLRRES